MTNLNCGRFVDIKFADLKLLCPSLDDKYNNSDKIYKVSDMGFLKTPSNTIT